jgi:hypothetical protein
VAPKDGCHPFQLSEFTDPSQQTRIWLQSTHPQRMCCQQGSEPSLLGGGTLTKLSDTVALVCLTDQTTIWFHTPPQPCSRSRDALAESRLADRENGSTLSTTHLKDFAQDIGESVLSVKAKQHAERAPELELFDEQFLFYSLLALQNTVHMSTFCFHRFKFVTDKRERE